MLERWQNLGIITMIQNGYYYLLSDGSKSYL